MSFLPDRPPRRNYQPKSMVCEATNSYTVRRERRPSSLAVFIARCEARALLWQAGGLDLHAAVDELQAVAVRDDLSPS